MAQARQRLHWQPAAMLAALLANVHRDPQRQRPFEISDFDPTARAVETEDEDNTEQVIETLMRLFPDSSDDGERNETT